MTPSTEAVAASVEGILSTFPGVVLLHDFEGRILSCNAEAKRVFPQLDFLDGPFVLEQLFAHAPFSSWERYFSALPESILEYYLDWSSAASWFRVRAKGLVAEQGGKAVALLVFQSEPKLLTAYDEVESESAFSTSRNRRFSEREWLEQALRSLVVPVFLVGKDGVIGYVNDAAAHVFGYDIEELLGEPLSILMPREHARRHEEIVAEYLRTGDCSMLDQARDLVAVNKFGEEFPIRLTIDELKVGDERAFVSSVLDLRERRALEGELRQSQKMDALGRLAGGVAHDFNNLLMVINQNASMLQDGVEGEENRTLAAEIGEAGRRAADLSRQLLQFSRREVGEPKSLEAWTAVEGVAKMAQRLLPETHRLHIQSPDSPVYLRMDPGQLEQVLLNLIINARDAMPRGGEMYLSVFEELGKDDEQFAVFELRDEGHGMTEETRARIFEPFFTTKARERGTGLGLSTVFGIVSRARGRVDVTSALGRGSTFSVRLPAVSRMQMRSPQSVPASRARVCLRVALVEDDPLVRASTQRWLRAAGHRVHAFGTGEQALSWLGEHSVDVLLSDVVMAKMTGAELATRVARTQPKVPVVLISGHSEDVLCPESFPENACFLPKPFEPQDLGDLLIDLVMTSRNGPSSVKLIG